MGARLALLVCIMQVVDSVCNKRGVQCRVDLAFKADVTQERVRQVFASREEESCR
jgi:hypothetical protein